MQDKLNVINNIRTEQKGGSSATNNNSIDTELTHIRILLEYMLE